MVLGRDRRNGQNRLPEDRTSGEAMHPRTPTGMTLLTLCLLLAPLAGRSGAAPDPRHSRYDAILARFAGYIVVAAPVPRRPAREGCDRRQCRRRSLHHVQSIHRSELEEEWARQRRDSSSHLPGGRRRSESESELGFHVGRLRFRRAVRQRECARVSPTHRGGRGSDRLPAPARRRCWPSSWPESGAETRESPRKHPIHRLEILSHGRFSPCGLQGAPDIIAATRQS